MEFTVWGFSVSAVRLLTMIFERASCYRAVSMLGNPLPAQDSEFSKQASPVYAVYVGIVYNSSTGLHSGSLLPYLMKPS